MRGLLGKERARAVQKQRREGTEAPRQEHTCLILEMKAGQWTRGCEGEEESSEVRLGK